MSVFTQPSEEALARWIARYALGDLVEFKGIAGGVQNSNFFVTTTLGRYVLTLFETIDQNELPYYLHLMAHLARHGLPTPAPIANREGEYLSFLAGRAAVLVLRLSGTSVTEPTPEHCARLGAMLAGLHLAGNSYGRSQPNPRGTAWRASAANTVRPWLSAEDAALLDDELHFQNEVNIDKLPTGTIHGDLFRDNVLWENGFIGGVIDFYFAGQDALLFDVAVTVNDWCSRPDGSLDTAREEALLTAYARARPYTPIERVLWPAMLRAAALRFWLSRTLDQGQPREGKLVLVKNPAEYRDILYRRRSAHYALPVA